MSKRNKKARFTLKHAKYYLDTWPDCTKEEIVGYVVQDFFPHRSNEARFRRRAHKLLTEASAEQDEAKDDPLPIIGGVIEAAEDMRQWADGTTFVFTSAQANTFLNENFWVSLMALVEDRQASLHVSRFTYNKQRFGKNSVKPGTHDSADHEEIWFDPRIEPFVSDEQVQIAPDLIWCGELNIIPTRVDPISGFENYGRGASVIIPHTKMAMRSVPTMKDDPVRFCYTTGTVTARNYIEKAAGQKASLHHVYGALIVELDESGTWWARQVNADADGAVFDLTDKYTSDGNIERGQRAEIITHGDLHGNNVNTEVLEIITEKGGVLDALKPKNQVFHDSVDFQPRNHHNIKDPHFRHRMLTNGTDSVQAEFDYTATVLRKFDRESTVSWIVTSNHDQAIESWLRNTDGFNDPANMLFWLETNAYCAKHREQGTRPRPFKKVLTDSLGMACMWFNFVDEDESLIIAGIENGMHGHLGPNGARGSPKNLRTIGKANTGHTHSAGIVDGVYTAGVFGNLNMGYNKGLSSWSHSFIVTYPNGKRTIVTIKDGRAWR